MREIVASMAAVTAPPPSPPLKMLPPLLHTLPTALEAVRPARAPVSCREAPMFPTSVVTARGVAAEVGEVGSLRRALEEAVICCMAE